MNTINKTAQTAKTRTFALVTALFAVTSLGFASQSWSHYETHEGTLREGQSRRIPVELVAGYETMFEGNCTVSCSDLDFELFDPYGRSVDTDFLFDDEPVVSVSNPMSGWYTLEVTMVDCSNRNGCGFEADEFYRRR